MDDDQKKAKMTSTIKVISKDEEGRKRVEKAEVKARSPETLKYIERKLVDKGVQRMERRPADGLGLTHLPKSGRGAKYTWEGPGGPAESELEAAPPAIDERDPNYVEDHQVTNNKGDDEGEVAGLLVGEVEVAKVAEEKEGVARVEVHPPLQL